MSKICTKMTCAKRTQKRKALLCVTLRQLIVLTLSKASGRYKSNIMPDMNVSLSVGLDPDLYPSVCVEDYEDVQDIKERIFLGLRAIHDCKSHFSRTEPSEQALRFRRNALIWKGKKGEEGKMKRKDSEEGEKRKKDQKGKRRKKC